MNLTPSFRALVWLPMLLAATASAQTVTVNISADIVDINWQTATIADLPGPDGKVSFSEALIATNNTPGHQTIGFAIPQSDWTLQFAYPGRAVLTTTTGYFFRANDAVTIDGTTQTAFTGNTNPGGNEVVIYSATLYLNADHCVLLGFDSSAVQAGGSGTLFFGNSGSMNLTLFGGAGSLVHSNSAGTLKIDRSDDNIVVGNTVQRVRVLGGGSTQPAANNRIGGPTLAERNHITGYGTWNSEGLPAGAALQLAWTRGTRIENNWIGTTPDGLAQGNPACTMGISLESENHDVTVRRNLIAGILGQGLGPHHAGQLFGWAVYFWGSTTNIELSGNTIGLDANGDPTLGSVWGVNVDNYSFYTVTGVDLVDNVIAGQLLNGVRVAPSATIRLSANAIYSNGSLGIDLIPTSFASGVSPHDPLDADAGGNGVQNYPLLTSATLSGGALRVVGALHSSPLDAFTLEFFASPACDPSGHGQAQVFLGATSVTTDAAGDAAFDLSLPATAPSGWSVTATATLEPLGATSEFSACVPLQGEVGVVFCTGDGAGSVPCPCANHSPTAAQAGCLNSSGSGAALRGLGTTSVAADDLVLALSHLPSPSKGLFFMGSGAGAPKPLGDGLLCITPPLYRFPLQGSGPAGSFRFGPGLAAWSQAHLPAGAWISAGSTWRFQAWFRDPSGPCGTGHSLANGLEVTFTP